MKNYLAEIAGFLLLCGFIVVGKWFYHQVFPVGSTPNAVTANALSVPDSDSRADRIGMTAIGCKSLPTFKRMIALFKDTASPADAEEIARNMDSGECVELDAGERVTTIASIDITNTRVRPEGDSNAYWTFWAIVDRH